MFLKKILISPITVIPLVIFAGISLLYYQDWGRRDKSRIGSYLYTMTDLYSLLNADENSTNKYTIEECLAYWKVSKNSNLSYTFADAAKGINCYEVQSNQKFKRGETYGFIVKNYNGARKSQIYLYTDEDYLLYDFVKYTAHVEQKMIERKAMSINDIRYLAAGRIPGL